VTIALDTTAFLRRYLDEPDRDLVVRAMAGDRDWCASVLLGPEGRLALQRATVYEPQGHGALWQAFTRDLAAVALVPLDGRCLARAVEIGVAYGLGTDDAIHLAAADRLPRPLTYATFASAQIPAALDLGFDVLSP
jgi:uncharacterized protein